MWYTEKEHVFIILKQTNKQNIIFLDPSGWALCTFYHSCLFTPKFPNLIGLSMILWENASVFCSFVSTAKHLLSKVASYLMMFELRSKGNTWGDWTDLKGCVKLLALCDDREYC